MADTELVVEELMQPVDDIAVPLHGATFKHICDGPLHASTTHIIKDPTHLDCLLAGDVPGPPKVTP